MPKTTTTTIDWPDEFARTPADEREQNPNFSATLGQTTKDLTTEMNRLDPDEWRPSIGNQHTKSNGLPLHNANPDDPGFVLRWTKDGEQFAVACDAYSRLRDNIRTVYLWVHETRLRGQRPVKTGNSEFAAARLPPGEGSAGDEDVIVAGGRLAPHEILEVAPDADEATIRAAFRARASDAHPDQGGDEASLKRLVAAKEAMLDGE